MADIGRLLGGLGAAFKNEVPQFQQQMRQEDLYNQRMAEMKLQREQAAEDRDYEMRGRLLADDERRVKTLFTDTEAVMPFLEAGDYSTIERKFADRVNILGRAGVDTSNSTRITRLAMAASQGDVQAQEALAAELGRTRQAGITAGVIKGPQTIKASDIYRGNIVTRDSSGNITQTPVGGDAGYVSDDELRNQREKLTASMKGIKDSSSATLDTYKKIESLTAAVRAAQAPNASEDVLRAGRTALGTIQTLMARMASPGVVTDADFRTQAGAQGLAAAAMGYLQGSGINQSAIMATFDATDPLTVNPALIMEQAKALAAGSTSTLLNNFASNRRVADIYQMSNQFKDSYFKGDAARNLRTLGGLADPDFDSVAYFTNPSEYLNNRDSSASTPIEIVSAPKEYRYATEAESDAAADRGEYGPGDVIYIGNQRFEIGEEI